MIEKAKNPTKKRISKRKNPKTGPILFNTLHIFLYIILNLKERFAIITIYILGKPCPFFGGRG